MAANNTRSVDVKVTASGLNQVLRDSQKLNEQLDNAAKPRKTRAATAALDVSAASVGLGRGTAAAGRTGDTRDFARQAQGLGGLVHVYATFAANVYAVTAAFNALSKAMDFANMERAADILSVRLGVGIRGLAKEMKSLTDGAISMSEALSSASLGASAGLTTKQIRDLTSVAKGASIALGRDMTDALQRVFRGTIKIEPELLDELGVMVKVDDANKSYAKTLNKTVSSLTDYERRQAFVNAVTDQGISKYKDLADSMANPFSKLLSTMKDISTETLNIINSVLGPFVNLLSQSPTALLFGMSALATLLIKQAIPAVGEITKRWADMTKAAVEANKASIAQIDSLQQAADASKAALKSQKLEMIGFRDELLDKENKKGVGGKAISAASAALTKVLWDPSTSPEMLEANRKLAVDEITKARNKLVKEIEKLSKKTKIISIDGDFSSYEKDLVELNKYRENLARVDKAELTINKMVETASTTAINQRGIRAQDDKLIKLKEEGKILDQLTAKRAALAKGYEKADELGFMTGLKEINSQVNSLDLGIVQRNLQKLRGYLGVVTVSMSKLLGTFSIWGAAIAVLVPLLGGLTDWLGWTTEHANRLNESLTAVTDNLKLHADIQEKLKTSSSLEETFQLQAAAANAYADSLSKIAKANKDMETFKAKGGWLDNQVAIFKSFTGGGVLGSDTNMPMAEEFERRMREDKAFAAKNANLLKADMFGRVPMATEAISGEAAGLFTSTKDRMDTILKISKALSDPELEKSARDFNAASTGMIANLKELDTITNEYSMSLVNQSKELKALNAFSASTANAFKTLADPHRGGIANVSGYLKGLTNQFNEMSGVPLPTIFTKLSDGLAKVKKSADEIYAVRVDLAGNDQDKIKKAQEDRAESIKVGSNRELKNVGGLEVVQRELVDYSLKVSSAFAKLASAATDASIAQAKVNRSLRLSKFLTDISGSSSALAYRKELEAERRRVYIEDKARKTNASTIETSLKDAKELLDSMIRSIIAKIPINSMLGDISGYRGAALNQRSSPADRISALANVKGTNITDVGALTGVAANISSLQVQSAMARGESTVAHLGLTPSEEAALSSRLKKAADDIADKTNNISTKLESTLIEQDRIASKNSALMSTEVAARDEFNAQLDKAKSQVDLTEAVRKIQEELYNSVKQYLVAHKLVTPDGKVITVTTVDKKGFKTEKPKEYSEEAVKTLEGISERRDTATNAAARASAEVLSGYQEEANRKEQLRLGILQSSSAMLEQQNELVGEYSSRVLTISQDYSTLAKLTESSIGTLKTQVILEEQYNEAQKVKLLESLKVNDSLENQLLVAQQLAKLELDSLNSKLAKQKQLTSLIKQRTSLEMKTAEGKGVKETLSLPNLEKAATVMADRIEEVTGKSESWLHQFSTGIIDSVVTITDSFTTMIQRLSEERFQWRTFTEMVRNTFSDMIRNIASDMMKNAMLKFIKQGLESIKPGLGQSSEDKAAKQLGLNTSALGTLNTSIERLVGILSVREGAPAPIEDIDINTGVRTYSYPGDTSPEADRLGINTGPDNATIGTNSAALAANVLESENKMLVKPLAKAALVGEKAANTNDLASKKLFDASTIMQGAVGGIVGALVSGGSVKGALGGIAAGVATNFITKGITSMFFPKPFATGGIMSASGPVALNAYAKGGIATSPQISLFGEGRNNEAYVPLPDNRSIPVTLSGGSGGSVVVGDTKVTVNITNTSSGQQTSVDVDQAKGFSTAITNSIKAAIQEEIMKQSKPNGLLYRRA